MRSEWSAFSDASGAASGAGVVAGPGWAELVSWDNLLSSYQNAAQGKRRAPAVARFEFRLGEQLLRLQRQLGEQTWLPGPYLRFTVHEPKRRTISAAPFRDRIVHHALMRVIGPRFERSHHPHSFANRVGLGTHRAIEHVSQLARQHPWALRLDVQQHFQSIDHALLLDALRPRIPEPEIWRLVCAIVTSGAEPSDAPNALPPLLLPGDDLLSACRPCGLPIGNLTSQSWSNVYMDRLDQFIVRELGCRAYARYVDDMVLLADDKRTLRDWAEAVHAFAATRLRLRLHRHSAHPQTTAGGVPWLGMVIYPTHRLLKSRKVVAATRRLRAAWRDWQLGQAPFDALDAKVQGWIAHAAHANSWRIRERVLGALDLRPPPGQPFPPLH